MVPMVYISLYMPIIYGPFTVPLGSLAIIYGTLSLLVPYTYVSLLYHHAGRDSSG